MEAPQLELHLALQALHAGELGLQTVAAPLGGTQAQAQLCRLRLGMLQLDLQVAGIVQELLLIDAGLIQAPQQLPLPQAELPVQIRQLTVEIVELGRGEQKIITTCETPNRRLPGA